ncbi:hypothetical protein A9Q84_01760 [Halobacteriovorax marinus]|uniref:Uncharacterized protein n=1 Tax=Halobacteriovorax marinus TaxID=97084 RepID=A0A1Y5FCC1_9BACT|nr:hypothetical protein A9Q84_01760 [Halobacteriovorax marinus]
MITPYLTPIDEANSEEIEMYYKVEEAMQHSGELKMTEKEIYKEIDAHQSVNFLKTHDHFHFFTFIFSTWMMYIAYQNYIVYEVFTFSTILILICSIGMLGLSWVVAHPRLKHEKVAREYFRTHRTLFLYNT